VSQDEEERRKPDGWNISLPTQVLTRIQIWGRERESPRNLERSLERDNGRQRESSRLGERTNTLLEIGRRKNKHTMVKRPF